MKKVPFLLMISFVLVVTNVKADIVYPNRMTLKAQITNLRDFPEVVVVGLTEGGTFEDRFVDINGGVYKNELATSLMYGKKMFFYVVKKDYLEKVGLKKIDWQKDTNVQKLNLVNDWGALPSSEKYTAIDVEFKLAKKNKTYYVYKSKITAKPRVKEAQQPVADVVKTFTDKVVNPLEPIYISEKWMF